MLKKFSKGLLLLVCLFLINSCNFKNKVNTKYYCEKLFLNCDIEENILVFHTSKGKIKVQLFKESNPVTVANFISKVRTNIYSNKKFYNIISYRNNKLIHNGLGKDKNFGQFYTKEVPNNDSIPLEIKLNNKELIYETPITNPLKIKNLKHNFEKGSISMVKINKNRSSSTEFFFSLNNLPEFDGRYSIFGRVISGIEILDDIDKSDFIKKIEFF